MSLVTRLYVGTVIIAGFGALLAAVAHWQTSDPFRFLVYFSLAIPASCMKVKLPGVNGTMSVQFPFLLLAIAELSSSEALVMAATTVLVQRYWKASSRPKMVQLLFNLANISLSMAVAEWMYHLPLFAIEGLEEPLRLVSAVTAFFLANTLPVAGAIALTERKPLRQIWHECYNWSFPYYLVGATLVGLIRLLGKPLAQTRFAWGIVLLVLPAVYILFRSYRLYFDRLETERRYAEDQRQHAQAQQIHAEEMASLHLRTIEALALAIEAKDHTTHEHLERVQVYAVEVGRELGLRDDDLEALRAAALLHDIGKLAVPEHIISKPGRLTPEEFEKMKIHPVVGAEILERVQFPYDVVPIVRSHHEKWNGAGYPDGIKGTSIPIGARILSAVDCLDALASDRQYRRALPLDEAMQKVASESGTSFDPDVVEVLQRRYVELEVKARGLSIERMKLSTDIKIENGSAPAAGFESEDAPVKPVSPSSAGDFLASIAAARQEAQALFELTQDLGSSLSLNETLSVLSVRLKRMIPYDAIAVYIRREDILVPEFTSGDDFRLFSSLQIPVGQGLSGWVAENRKPIINGNPSVEPGYLNDPNKFSTLRAALAVPLEGLQGVIGVLTLYQGTRDSFSPDHLRMLLAISSKLALAVENALKYHAAETSATTDYLTGLPNGGSLFLHLGNEVARCGDAQLTLAVLVCDLNGFKQVNDVLGHLEGNRVLRELARRFREACTGDEYAARMGGDEFVLVLPDCQLTSAQERAAVLEEIAHEVGTGIFGAELSLSVGIAMFPDEATDAEQLLNKADRRMYSNKAHHINIALEAARKVSYVGRGSSSSNAA